MKVGVLQVHRCVWCGVIVTTNPQSLNIVKDVSVLCCDCLEWIRDNGDVVIKNIDLKRGRLMEKDLE